MGIETAIIGGAALLGGIAGSKGSKSTQTTASTTKPWDPQAQHLQTAFDAAQTNFDAANARPGYQGPLTAGMNDQQRAALAAASGYAQGPGAALPGQVAGVSSNLMGSAGSFAQTAGALSANGAGPANGTATGVLTNAANGAPMGTSGIPGSVGQTGQIASLGTAQTLAASGQRDLNPTIQAQAGGYVDENRIQGQVDAVTRDVSRTLNESTLPGLNARAAAGGNLNSARAGAAEAVARRGAEDRVADVSAGLRTAAFDTGVQASLQANGQQNQLALGANGQAIGASGALSNLGENQRQFDTGTTLQAATTLGSQDIANRGLDAQTRLSANGQQGQATQMGLGAAGTGGVLAGQNAQLIAAGGDAQQVEEQRVIDEQRAAYDAEELRKRQSLQAYMQIVGSNQWGSQTNGTVTNATPANPIGGALGGAAMGASMFAPGATAGPAMVRGITGLLSPRPAGG